MPLREFLRGMMERRDGAIVTMSSSAARQPSRASAPYAVAKGAVITLTHHIAAEAAPSNVRVNCIAPGAILSDRLAQQPEQIRNALAQSYPLKRLGQTSDVSSAALFLLSGAAAWISGITLDVAGGSVVS